MQHTPSAKAERVLREEKTRDLLRGRAEGRHVGGRKQGETLHQIGQLLDRPPAPIRRILAGTSGIRPLRHRRPSRARSLAEREEISRAVAAGESLQSISRRLGRAASRPSAGRSVATAACRATGQLRPIRLRGPEHGGPRSASGSCHRASRHSWPRSSRSNGCPGGRPAGSGRPTLASDPAGVPWSDLPQPQHRGTRGALKKVLLERLRRTRGMRRSRHHTQKTGIHGQVPDTVSISERLATVEDRAVPCMGKVTRRLATRPSRSLRWRSARPGT